MRRNCPEVNRRHMFERQAQLTEPKRFISRHPKSASSAILTQLLQCKQDHPLRHSSPTQWADRLLVLRLRRAATVSGVQFVHDARTTHPRRGHLPHQAGTNKLCRRDLRVSQSLETTSSSGTGLIYTT